MNANRPINNDTPKQCVTALGLARCPGTALPGTDRCESCHRERRA